MRPHFAILANYAEVTDGKYTIVGGDIDTVHVEKFPGILPQIYLVAKLEVTEQDIGQTPSVGMKLVDPEGKTLAGPPPGTLYVDPAKACVGQSAGIVLNIVNPTFPSPGRYSLQLLIDDTVLVSLPFNVIERGPSDA